MKQIKELVWEEVDRGFDNSWKAEVPSLHLWYYILQQGSEYTLEVCGGTPVYEVSDGGIFNNLEDAKLKAQKNFAGYVLDLQSAIKCKESECKKQKEILESCFVGE